MDGEHDHDWDYWYRYLAEQLGPEGVENPEAVTKAVCDLPFSEAGRAYWSRDWDAMEEFVAGQYGAGWTMEKVVGEPRREDGFVYILRAENNLFKIGKARNLDRRVAGIGLIVPFEIELVCAVKTDAAGTLERSYHVRHMHKRVRGEWFRLSLFDVAWFMSRGEHYFFQEDPRLRALIDALDEVVYEQSSAVRPGSCVAKRLGASSLPA